MIGFEPGAAIGRALTEVDVVFPVLHGAYGDDFEPALLAAVAGALRFTVMFGRGLKPPALRAFSMFRAICRPERFADSCSSAPYGSRMTSASTSRPVSSGSRSPH